MRLTFGKKAVTLIIAWLFARDGISMAVYRIETFEDILKALKEQPQWREELRRLVLTDELLALPQRFERFVEEDFRPLRARVDKMEGDGEVLKQDVTVLKQDVAVLKQDVAVLKEDVAVLKQDVAVLKEDVAVLKQDVAVLKQDVAVLKQDVKRLKDDVAELKGESFERRVRERAPSYFGRLIKGCKTLSFQELDQVLEAALEKGIISQDEKDDALNVDVVVTGLSRSEEGVNILVVCEVSIKADRQDVERAFQRASILRKAFGISSIPTIIAKSVTKGARVRGEELGVILL